MTREVQEAAKYVLPLNNDTFARAVAPRPSATAGKTVFTYSGVNSSINSSNAPNILGRSYRITAEVDVPQGGGDGMLVTMGGRWGGYGLYLLKGKPEFDWQHARPRSEPLEGPDTLTAGKHTIVFDYTHDGRHRQDRHRGAEGRRQGLCHTEQPNSIAFLQAADGTFDVGRRHPHGVNDKDYQVPFPFNGTISKVTSNLGPMQLAEEDKEKAAKAIAIASDSADGRTRTPKQVRRTGSAW